MTGQDDVDLRETGPALARLAEDEDAFLAAAKAFVNNDADSFREILEKFQVLDRYELVCNWFCSWHCMRVCRLLCRELPVEPPGVAELREFAEAFAALGREDGAVERLLATFEKEDADAFNEILERFKLTRWCYLVCQWVCYLRCRRFCWLVGKVEDSLDLHRMVLESAEALGVLARDEKAFGEVHEAADAEDLDRIRQVLVDLQIVPWCRWICWWLCVRWCVIRCIRICPPDVKLPELEDLPRYARRIARLSADIEAMDELRTAFEAQEAKTVSQILRRFDLPRFCHPVCLWVCHWRCRPFCFRLCPPPEPLPLFRKVGGYVYTTQIDSAGGGTGLTLGDNRAFFQTLRLNGVLYQKLYGQPMEYKFEVDTGAGWADVVPTQIARTVIGTWTHFVGGPDPVESKDYTVNGANGPDEITITPQADGWIKVPQEADFWGSAGAFTSNGNMVNFISPSINPDPDIDLAGVAAGQSTAPAGLANDQVVGLRMVVRQVGSSGAGTVAGHCDALAIDNRLYDHVAKHGDWAPATVDDQFGAAMVNIDEIGGGCGKIDDVLTVEYTAAHPNLGTVSLSMNGPGGPYSFTMTDAAGSTPVDRFGTAVPTVPVGPLDRCAYAVTLTVTLLLTTGDGNADPIYDDIAFCK